MQRSHFVVFPDRNPQPITVAVHTRSRHQAAIAEVEMQRRLAGDAHVHIALRTEAGAHNSDERVLVDLVGSKRIAVPCGQLSDQDSPGWRWLLRMRFEPRVIWIWPARILPMPSSTWGVEFYH